MKPTPTRPSMLIGLMLAATQPDPDRRITLGSGHRGLVFTILSNTDAHEKPFTVALACNLNPGYSMCATYLNRPNDTRILLKETLTEPDRRALPANYWSGGTTKGLFSFGENAAFDGRDLYRIEKGHIRICVRAAQPEARKEYGLSGEQVFLGAFEQRVFYWVEGRPREVFFRTRGRTFRYLLHGRVTKPLGMAKGDPKGDLALEAVVKPAVGWYPSPRTFEWIILDLKDAMPADGLGVGLSDTRTSSGLSVRIGR